MTDIREILRRLRMGEHARRIARDLEVSRNTVAHYQRWATERGLLTGPLPDPAALAALLATPPEKRPAQEQSLVEPFNELVLAWHAKGIEGQAIWQLLVEQHGFGGSYSSIKRFLRRVAPPTPRATLRLEVDPGAEAQVDFGAFRGRALAAYSALIAGGLATGPVVLQVVGVEGAAPFLDPRGPAIHPRAPARACHSPRARGAACGPLAAWRPSRS